MEGWTEINLWTLMLLTLTLWMPLSRYTLDAAFKIHDALFGVVMSFKSVTDREAAMAFIDHLLAETLENQIDYSDPEIGTWGRIYAAGARRVMDNRAGNDINLINKGAALILPKLNVDGTEKMKTIFNNMLTQTDSKYDDAIATFIKNYTQKMAAGEGTLNTSGVGVGDINDLSSNFNTMEQKMEQDAQNNQSVSGTGDVVALSQTATVDTNTDGITPVTPTQYTPTELASLVNAGVLGSNPSYNVVFKNAKQVSLSMDISSDNYNMANQAATISVVPANVSTAATTTGTSYIFANALAGTRNPHVNVDPLVLDLGGDGIELLLFGAKETYFDTDNDGYQERTGWVGKDDGILVHDLNGNGKIDDITETISEYYKAPKGGGSLGGTASNPFKSGFDALKTLDTSALGGNGDGVINSADSVWNELRVWQDANGDGISHSTGTNPVSELKTLASLGLQKLSWRTRRMGRLSMATRCAPMAHI